jgi:hypothetical protein
MKLSLLGKISLFGKKLTLLSALIAAPTTIYNT